MPTLMQVAECGSEEELVDFWTLPIKWFEGVICPYANVVGELFAFGLVIMMLNMALYGRQGRLILPATVTLVSGGAWISLTPGAVTGAVQAGILILLGVGPVLLIRRLDS